MVILSIIINVKPAKRREFVSTCRMIADQTRQEKGCLDYYLSSDIANDNIIQIEQRWERRLYMDNHLRSDLFSALNGAIQILGESYEIRINESTQTEGVEEVLVAQSQQD